MVQKSVGLRCRHGKYTPRDTARTHEFEVRRYVPGGRGAAGGEGLEGMEPGGNRVGVGIDFSGGCKVQGG
jgi:hypothetical protein